METYKTVGIRMARALRAELQIVARAQKRSLSAQITIALEEWLRDHFAKPRPTDVIDRGEENDTSN